MITVASQELKRRGISIIEEDCRREPVHVIRNNRPEYVILLLRQFRQFRRQHPRP